METGLIAMILGDNTILDFHYVRFQSRLEGNSIGYQSHQRVEVRLDDSRAGFNTRSKR
ncbi:MAG: hypothetical protein ACJAWV_001002 [Flammeovirgaceae bacterium]|jgi:hypothetical protein